MATAGLRIGVIGATGALGSEVLACLDASSLRVAELLPVATDRSLGEEIEFQGEIHPVETELRSLRGLDLVFLCAPPAASLDFAREALRAQVSCVDLSGALATNDDVPLRVAAFGLPEGERQPLVAGPPAAALAWALVLRPLAELAGLRRVAGTVLEAASLGGRDGIQALGGESIAIFNQDELPEPTAFPRPVAFDCLPTVGALVEGGRTDAEQQLALGLARLLGDELRVSATVVQVPIFVGQGTSLAVECERPLDAAEAREALGKAPGVEIWEGDPADLTVRAGAGREAVLVGRIRPDPSVENGLLLWVVADVLRLAAANGVAIAEGRPRLS